MSVTEDGRRTVDGREAGIRREGRTGGSRTEGSARARGAGIEAAVVVLAVTLGVIALVPPRASSHIVREEPWHPVAAAYLRSLFYLGLSPVDWELVAAEYEAPLQYGDGDEASGDEASGGEPTGRPDARNAYEVLGGIPGAGGTDHAVAIRSAIEARDAEALYVASTRAMARLVRSRLEAAAVVPDRAAGAIRRALRYGDRQERMKYRPAGGPIRQPASGAHPASRRRAAAASLRCFAARA